MTADEILQESLKLSTSDRAKVAEELLLSMRDAHQKAIDDAWCQEAERRIDLVESGQMETEPVEEVLESLRRARG